METSVLVLETPAVVRATTEPFCRSVPTVQVAVIKLYRCVVQIIIKPKVEEGYGPSSGASGPRPNLASVIPSQDALDF